MACHLALNLLDSSDYIRQNRKSLNESNDSLNLFEAAEVWSLLIGTWILKNFQSPYTNYTAKKEIAKMTIAHNECINFQVHDE